MTIKLTGTLEALGAFPLVDQADLLGSYRSVVNTLARDAIITQDRVEGMLVRTNGDGKYWRLGPGLTNGDWVEVTFGSTSTAVGGFFDSIGNYNTYQLSGASASDFLRDNGQTYSVGVLVRVNKVSTNQYVTIATDGAASMWAFFLDVGVDPAWVFRVDEIDAVTVTPTDIPIGRFVLLTASYDGTDATFYIDGKLAGTYTVATAAAGAATFYLAGCIGSSEDNFDTGGFFYSDAALTADQHAQVMRDTVDNGKLTFDASLQALGNFAVYNADTGLSVITTWDPDPGNTLGATVPLVQTGVPANPATSALPFMLGISALPYAPSINSVGAGASVVASPSGSTANLRSLTSSDGSVTITQSATELDFSTSGGAITYPLDLYVATTGNDANTGLTPLTAVATLSRVWELIPPVIRGPVVVHVASGTYAWVEPNAVQCLTPDARVYFWGDGAGQPGDDGFTVIASGVAGATTTTTALELAVDPGTDVYMGYTLECESAYRMIYHNAGTPSLAYVIDAIGAMAAGSAYRVLRPGVTFTYTPTTNQIAIQDSVLGLVNLKLSNLTVGNVCTMRQADVLLYGVEGAYAVSLELCTAHPGYASANVIADYQAAGLPSDMEGWGVSSNTGVCVWQCSSTQFSLSVNIANATFTTWSSGCFVYGSLVGASYLSSGYHYMDVYGANWAVFVPYQGGAVDLTSDLSVGGISCSSAVPVQTGGGATFLYGGASTLTVTRTTAGSVVWAYFDSSIQLDQLTDITASATGDNALYATDGAQLSFYGPNVNIVRGSCLVDRGTARFQGGATTFTSGSVTFRGASNVLIGGTLNLTSGNMTIQQGSNVAITNAITLSSGALTVSDSTVAVSGTVSTTGAFTLTNSRYTSSAGLSATSFAVTSSVFAITAGTFNVGGAFSITKNSDVTFDVANAGTPTTLAINYSKVVFGGAAAFSGACNAVGSQIMFIAGAVTCTGASTFHGCTVENLLVGAFGLAASANLTLNDTTWRQANTVVTPLSNVNALTLVNSQLYHSVGAASIGSLSMTNSNLTLVTGSTPSLTVTDNTTTAVSLFSSSIISQASTTFVMNGGTTSTLSLSNRSEFAALGGTCTLVSVTAASESNIALAGTVTITGALASSTNSNISMATNSGTGTTIAVSQGGNLSCTGNYTFSGNLTVTTNGRVEITTGNITNSAAAADTAISSGGLLTVTGGSLSTSTLSATDATIHIAATTTATAFTITRSRAEVIGGTFTLNGAFSALSESDVSFAVAIAGTTTSLSVTRKSRVGFAGNVTFTTTGSITSGSQVTVNSGTLTITGALTFTTGAMLALVSTGALSLGAASTTMTDVTLLLDGGAATIPALTASGTTIRHSAGLATFSGATTWNNCVVTQSGGTWSFGSITASDTNMYFTTALTNLTTFICDTCTIEFSGAGTVTANGGASFTGCTTLFGSTAFDAGGSLSIQHGLFNIGANLTCTSLSVTGGATFYNYGSGTTTIGTSASGQSLTVSNSVFYVGQTLTAFTYGSSAAANNGFTVTFSENARVTIKTGSAIAAASQPMTLTVTSGASVYLGVTTNVAANNTHTFGRNAVDTGTNGTITVSENASLVVGTGVTLTNSAAATIGKLALNTGAALTVEGTLNTNNIDATGIVDCRVVITGAFSTAVGAITFGAGANVESLTGSTVTPAAGLTVNAGAVVDLQGTLAMGTSQTITIASGSLTLGGSVTSTTSIPITCTDGIFRRVGATTFASGSGTISFTDSQVFIQSAWTGTGSFTATRCQLDTKTTLSSGAMTLTSTIATFGGAATIAGTLLLNGASGAGGGAVTFDAGYTISSAGGMTITDASFLASPNGTTNSITGNVVVRAGSKVHGAFALSTAAATFNVLDSELVIAGTSTHTGAFTATNAKITILNYDFTGGAANYTYTITSGASRTFTFTNCQVQVNGTGGFAFSGVNTANDVSIVGGSFVNNGPITNLDALSITNGCQYTQQTSALTTVNTITITDSAFWMYSAVTAGNTWTATNSQITIGAALSAPTGSTATFAWCKTEITSAGSVIWAASNASNQLTLTGGTFDHNSATAYTNLGAGTLFMSDGAVWNMRANAAISVSTLTVRDSTIVITNNSLTAATGTTLARANVNSLGASLSLGATTSTGSIIRTTAAITTTTVTYTGTTIISTTTITSAANATVISAGSNISCTTLTSAALTIDTGSIVNNTTSTAPGGTVTINAGTLTTAAMSPSTSARDISLSNGARCTITGASTTNIGVVTVDNSVLSLGANFTCTSASVTPLVVTNGGVVEHTSGTLTATLTAGGGGATATAATLVSGGGLLTSIKATLNATGSTNTHGLEVRSGGVVRFVAGLASDISITATGTGYGIYANFGSCWLEGFNPTSVVGGTGTTQDLKAGGTASVADTAITAVNNFVTDTAGSNIGRAA